MSSLKRPVFAANWKMNHGPTDARAFMRSFLSHYPRRSDRLVIFFPPAVSMAAVVDSLRDRPDLRVGVQNIHWEDKGAFTGETSAPMARDAGASVALVGHSERRHIFGETEEETAKKLAAAIRAGLIPLLCVGETLSQRDVGAAERTVVAQLRAGVSLVQPGQLPGVAIAYEPVWAIGTGRNATPADASLMHGVIRSELRGILGEKSASVPILYGGSVNRGNASLLLSAEDVDGVLVGGASLDSEGWSSIVRA